MKKIFFFLCLILSTYLLFAGDESGVYSFNKGVNKANGTLFLFHFTEDSSFFYLSCFSGAPDFSLVNVKGFLKMDSNKIVYKNNPCQILFTLKPNNIILSNDSTCQFEHSIEGAYKKSSPILKKTNTWFTNYTERNAKLKKDSVQIYFAPSKNAKIIGMLKIDSKIHILDEVGQFYLVELANKKNEFYWIDKANAIIPK